MSIRSQEPGALFVSNKFRHKPLHSSEWYTFCPKMPEIQPIKRDSTNSISINSIQFNQSERNRLLRTSRILSRYRYINTSLNLKIYWNQTRSTYLLITGFIETIPTPLHFTHQTQFHDGSQAKITRYRSSAYCKPSLPALTKQWSMYLRHWKQFRLQYTVIIGTLWNAHGLVLNKQ